MLKALTIASTVTFAAPAICFAGDDQPLTIGDPAPALDISHWFKGEPVEAFEQGKIYVMDFWATWCGPCIATMPHLSELQEKYKDYGVTFIGVSNEAADTVREFLTTTYKADGKPQDERIRFTLTTDTDKSVWNEYFYAAERMYIPCSFIVGKDGKIDFIGSPRDMDEALESIVHDKWDRETFKTTYEESMRIPRLQSRAMHSKRAEDWDKALEIYDTIIELEPGNIDAIMQKMMILVISKKDYENGYALARTVVKENPDDTGLLNSIAWNIATLEGIEQRDLDLALAASMQANKVTNHENAALLDTLARVYFERGDLANAIKWQSKAAELADDDALGKSIRKTLENYRAESK